MNIFVFKKEPLWLKIGDFGFTKRLIEGPALHTQVFTKNYGVPEALGYYGSGLCEMTSTMDIWSLGIITYDALTGEVPFDSEDRLAGYIVGTSSFR